MITDEDKRALTPVPSMLFSFLVVVNLLALLGGQMLAFSGCMEERRRRRVRRSLRAAGRQK